MWPPGPEFGSLYEMKIAVRACSARDGPRHRGSNPPAFGAQSGSFPESTRSHGSPSLSRGEDLEVAADRGRLDQAQRAAVLAHRDASSAATGRFRRLSSASGLYESGLLKRRRRDRPHVTARRRSGTARCSSTEKSVSCPLMNTGQPKLRDGSSDARVALRLEHVDRAERDVARPASCRACSPNLRSRITRTAAGRHGDAHLAVGDEHLRLVARHHGRAGRPARGERGAADPLVARTPAAVAQVHVLRVGDEPGRLPRGVLAAVRDLTADVLPHRGRCCRR